MKNEILYRGFDNIPSRRGRGGTYSYVRWQDVADRMNEAFGLHWSSEATSQEVIAGNIIIRVKVTVVNPETGLITSQEGFGGAPEDANAEAGNPFKAAYSKALKDACKKWGVALYLEEDEASSNTQPHLPPGYSGKEVATPTPTTPATKTIQPPLPTPEAANPVPPLQQPIDTVPAASTGMPMPPGVAMAGHAEQEAIVSKMETSFTPPPPASPPAPTAPPAPSVPSIPTPSTPAPPRVQAPEVPMTPPVAMNQPTINTGEPERISDVQKAALHSILQFKGVEYEALAQEAFEFNGVVKNPIPPADDLTYQEAVYVVKYGNDKFRKR